MIALWNYELPAIRVAAMRCGKRGCEDAQFAVFAPPGGTLAVSDLVDAANKHHADHHRPAMRAATTKEDR